MKRNNTVPKCHWSSGNAYPFCFGAKYPHEFAENDCVTCPWYSQYWHERNIREFAEMKKFNVDECEIEIIKDQF